MKSLYFPSLGAPSLQLIPLPFIPKSHDLPQSFMLPWKGLVTSFKRGLYEQAGSREQRQTYLKLPTDMDTVGVLV